MRTRADLRPYQVRAVEFIKAHQNCALFLDPGLGKTVSSLTAYADLRASFDAEKALVIAPLRVARKTWPDEIKVWEHLQDLRIAPMHGALKDRLAALNAKADIHTINRENVSWLVEQFIQGKKQIRKWPWDLVVIDESQSFKPASSQRFKALRKVRRLFPRCVELTGTPAPNGYEDLWSQIFLLDRGERLGPSMKAFHDRWFTPELGDGYCTWHIRAGAAEQIQEAIRDIVLSMRAEDYLDLPPVLYNPVRVALSPVELATYRKFARKSIAEFNGKTVTAATAGVLYGKLLQLANGAIYTDEKQAFEVFHDEKIAKLLELLDTATGPVMVGYSYKSDIVRITAALTKAFGTSKRWAVARSDEDLNRFARGTLDILLLHPASAGHGLNDMHASGSETVIWFGLPPNLEWFQQLNARLTGGLRRLGKSIGVHMLVADDTKDEDMVPLLTDKTATQDELTKALVDYAKS